MATITSGESIPDIAGDVVVHVVRALIRELDQIDWALIRQGREVIEFATREQIEDFLRDDETGAMLRMTFAARLREHVQEVAG